MTDIRQDNLRGNYQYFLVLPKLLIPLYECMILQDAVHISQGT